MEILSWGSPLGIGLLIFFSTSGTGILFWGIAHLSQKDK